MTTYDTTTAWAAQRLAIRRELKRQEMSQAELARRIGITTKHMSQMLTGVMDGRLELWVAMADALGLEWQLRHPDPVDAIVNFAREELGLTVEPWQAARMRAFFQEL